MRPSSKERGGRNLPGFNRRATQLDGMQQPSNPEVIPVRTLKLGWRFALLLLGAAAALVVALAVDLPYLERLNTYGNFDAPSDHSFVNYLWPGTPDRAAERLYRFDHGTHWTPIIALLIVFAVFYVLRIVGSVDVKMGISRGLTAWAAFVVARFGLLRVSGTIPVKRCTYGIFPFLNCQACEMASGGCPIGAFQASLLQMRFPLLPLTVLVVTGLALGRWICGWLCPFGLISDMFDRFSKRNLVPRTGWRAMAYVVLILVVVTPLIMAAAGGATWLPFCATLCPSGFVYGLLPFYATSGAGDFGAAFTAGHGAELAAILFHVAIFALFVWLAIRISGRVFCRYLCPLGAFLGLFHKISFVRIEHEETKCNDCGKCAKKCPMGINLSQPEFLIQSSCIRCGRCVKLCPSNARRWAIGWAGKPEKEPDGGVEVVLSSDPQG